MDLRDCQKLASLIARVQPEPEDPFQTLHHIFEECGALARTMHDVERDGRAGAPPLQDLRAELIEVFLGLAGLANNYGMNLAEGLEARRRAFFQQHPHLVGADAPPAIPQRIERVTVYAASSQSARPSLLAAAEELGRLLALQGWAVVYGGGSIGLMGALSRGVRAHHGRIIGVILDRFITSGASDSEVPDMKTVSTMRSRKRGLEETGDAFICLPGGLGTLEEIFETLSFRHLGFHHKPIVMCNVEGFWDAALHQLERCFAEQLIPESSRSAYQIAATPVEAVEILLAWKPPSHAAPSQAAELASREPFTPAGPPDTQSPR
jgi:uncharacterized protein (TIGR00730 family)